ncbi:hypothetical protein [Filomicrobium sp.]|uniref:hypothetical protein n=1 Tax=Filomicrobium sp. TaxID=2024831 RepID=UPI0025851C31|nr:hypothetical protein [Filomicrobium sp.]MCV0371922.1 hypothetical protein [Filomicrobium sp.]
MTDKLPPHNLLRHIDPDSHALNAICITQHVLSQDPNEQDQYGFVERLGGTLKMYELIQEMTNAVSQFECRYDHSPWNDLIAADWESTCYTYTSRVISLVMEHGDWPDFHAILLDVIFARPG